MKTVFSSRELAHVWASGNQVTGRAAGANMRFDEGAFYSYSTVIARRGVHKGQEFYIVDNARFSSTTSGHQAVVRNALRGRDNAKVFDIEIGHRGQDLILSRREIVSYYMRLADDNLAKTSRYAFNRASYLLGACVALMQAKRAAEFFGLEVSRINNRIGYLQPAADAAEKLLDDHWEAKRIRAEKREAQRMEVLRADAIGAARQFLADETADDCNLWRRDLLPAGLADEVTAEVARRNAGKVAAWRRGENVSLPDSLPDICRLNGAEVETNRGASVPLEHVRRALPVVLGLIHAGKTYQANGHTIHLGHYILDSIDAAGTVAAGCHRFTRHEIEHLAGLVG